MSGGIGPSRYWHRCKLPYKIKQGKDRAEQPAQDPASVWTRFRAFGCILDNSHGNALIFTHKRKIYAVLSYFVIQTFGFSCGLAKKICGFVRQTFLCDLFSATTHSGKLYAVLYYNVLRKSVFFGVCLLKYAPICITFSSPINWTI